jgi:hypothetical protein
MPNFFEWLIDRLEGNAFRCWQIVIEMQPGKGK